MTQGVPPFGAQPNSQVPLPNWPERIANMPPEKFTHFFYQSSAAILHNVEAVERELARIKNEGSQGESENVQLLIKAEWLKDAIECIRKGVELREQKDLIKGFQNVSLANLPKSDKMED